MPRTARPALTAAFRLGLGDHCRQTVRPRRSCIPLIRCPFLPVISYRPDVRRFRNLRYGDERRARSPPRRVRRQAFAAGCLPVLIYLHGGGFRIGSKMLGARPLLYRLASHGWVCVSANYRRNSPCPRMTILPVIDVKRVIAWVREHGAAYGADPSTVILAGGSSGVASCCDRSTHCRRRAVPARLRSGGHLDLWGGRDAWLLRSRRQRGPRGPKPSHSAYLHAEAPPFLTIDGALDTLVLVEDAHHFADELAEGIRPARRLRRASRHRAQLRPLPLVALSCHQ